MTKPYKDSRLWQKAFEDSNDSEIRRLATLYEAAWDRACSLSSRIKSDAVGLTLHDEHHFKALWLSADLLVPKDMILTPVETFVFGIAVLIHDAAHTTLAFEGGLEAISKTPEWADSLATRAEDDMSEETRSDYTRIPLATRQAVLFDTARALHAKQAEKLLSLPFNHPTFNEPLYLIDDQTVRRHMGPVIGQVAASHHWDISELSHLKSAVYPPAPFDKFGPIRRMFLAALMRTSDAIQIDSARALDFDFALANPSGISREHWGAQNKLAKGTDPNDPTALLINSTAPFGEADANAWWIAYDLASVADKELRNTDAILRDYASDTLQISRVRDAGDPSRFAQHVKTDGWYPVSAEIKVTNTEKIIEMLGGRGLYGNDMIVPLREIVQNAIDAIRARRNIDCGFDGKIIVELDAPVGDGASYCLRVADEGIGMSESVLTGPFLTFGESGWSSSVMRSERPGFLGKRFKKIGRYGIGFFSIFMISEQVRVKTRPFDGGKVDARLLEFRSGLGLRPLVKVYKPNRLSVVTSVEASISSADKNNIIICQNGRRAIKPRANEEHEAQFLTMLEVVGMVCPAIDVDIEVYDSDSGIRGTIGKTWQADDGVEWLCRINGIDAEEIPSVIRDNVALMTPTGDGGAPSGRASLSPVGAEFGVFTVGGLARKKRSGLISAQHHFGSIDSKPSGPRRDVGRIDDRGLDQWATDQVEAWSEVSITPQEQNFIASNACHFGGDPYRLANALVDGEWCTLEKIFEKLLHGVINVPIQPVGRAAEAWRVMREVNISSGFMYQRQEIKVEERGVLVSGLSYDNQEYWGIAADGELEENSLLGSLLRFVRRKGRELTMDVRNIDYGYYCGPTIPSYHRKKGERIKLTSLVIGLACSA